MEKKIMIIHPEDNVAVALMEIHAGTIVMISGKEYPIMEEIPFGHKVSVSYIQKGDKVVKYGNCIGTATKDILCGCHVHTHNVKTRLNGILEYFYQPDEQRCLDKRLYFKNKMKDWFYGYRRESGAVGIRNEIWIIPMVGCVNKTAQRLASDNISILPDGVDGIYAYEHNMGCSQIGEDLLRTQKILCGLVKHPNAAGVLVLSLGCENNQIQEIKKMLGDIRQFNIQFLTVQDVEDEMECGTKILKELCNKAARYKREKVSVSELTIGMKCGGSDAFSGITANPLCGIMSDCLCEYGGTVILTEVPEMFGAENGLLNRSDNLEVFQKYVRLINGYKEYFLKYNQPVYENPSPGNKAGGITTLEEKSLGCVQKGGVSKVMGVLDYGEYPKSHGLQILNGPGNDQISSTNLTASGANLLLFTTGRGNPFGAPVPTIKVSSNSKLAEKKKQWIDFDAGVILSESREQTAELLWDYMLEVASGKIKTNNEKFGYREISIFRDGVIL